MMHRRTLIATIVALVVFIIGGAFFWRGATAAGSHGLQSPAPPNFTVGSGKPGWTAPGATAISPSGAKHASVVLSAGVVPSLTEADVRAYFAHVGMPQAAAGVHPIVAQISFITTQQARALTNGAFNDRPDDVTVCYVLLKGPFNFPISLPPGAKDEQPTENYVQEVFDAYSGNFLMMRIPPANWHP